MSVPTAVEMTIIDLKDQRTLSLYAGQGSIAFTGFQRSIVVHRYQRADHTVDLELSHSNDGWTIKIPFSPIDICSADIQQAHMLLRGMGYSRIGFQVMKNNLAVCPDIHPFFSMDDGALTG